MIRSESKMRVQQSSQFSAVGACCLFSGVAAAAAILCVILVVANQSSNETSALSSKLQDYDTRIRQLERQIIGMGLMLENTEKKLHQLEQLGHNFPDQRTDDSSDSLGPRDPHPVHNATTVENTNWIDRQDGDDEITSGIQRRIMENSKQEHSEQGEDKIKARGLRSTRQRRRERPEREPKQCSKRCKGANGDKGDKGDVGRVSYGGPKGKKGDSGPAAICECNNPTTEPDTTSSSTTSKTVKADEYITILAAHFEGDVDSIAEIARRDPINIGYVDLGATSHGGWVPYWRYAQWMNADTRDKFYLDVRGNVTVIEGGIYYVYSQMLYYDPSVFMGHSLYIGGQKRFSCTECTVDRDRKFNTCYIGGVVQINAGDKVGVKVSYANRVINLNPDSTHFGMIRLS